MAGKELYIGRMLAALETSMNNVSNGMAESVSILEQMLENQGIERKNEAYSGQKLVDLDPVFRNGDDIELGPDCTIDVNRALNFYKQSQAGVETVIASSSYMKVKGKVIKTWKFPLTLKLTVSVVQEVSARSLFVSNRLPSAIYGNTGIMVTAFPNGNKDTRMTNYNIPSSQTGQSTDYLYADEKYNVGDDEEIIFYFGNCWNVTSATVTSIWSFTDADGKSLLSSGEMVEADGVYSVNGRGSIEFPIDLSGTAGELSDVKIIADLNDVDTIDLLTAAGDLYQADTGLTIPLSQFAALAFKLKFNFTTGSTLSGINVRYY